MQCTNQTFSSRPRSPVDEHQHEFEFDFMMQLAETQAAPFFNPHLHQTPPASPPSPYASASASLGVIRGRISRYTPKNRATPRAHIPDERYRCPLPGHNHVCHSQADFDNHISDCIEDPTIPCSFCKKSFTNEKSRNRHERTVHRKPRAHKTTRTRRPKKEYVIRHATPVTPVYPVYPVYPSHPLLPAPTPQESCHYHEYPTSPVSSQDGFEGNAGSPVSSSASSPSSATSSSPVSPGCDVTSDPSPDSVFHSDEDRFFMADLGLVLPLEYEESFLLYHSQDNLFEEDQCY